MSLSIQDKILGLIYGGALGDALGAPHEFRCNHGVYTGELYLETMLPNKRDILPIGSVTDDTNMHLTIIKSLLTNNMVYNKEHIIESYIQWAQTEKCLGINTRKLFNKTKTLKKYYNAIAKVGSEHQSNGSMMRCGILALYDDEIIKTDCYLSNPNEVNLECNLLLLHWIKDIINSKFKKEDMKQFIINHKTNNDDISNALHMALNKELRDVTKNKGWCVHALYCAVYTFLYFDNFMDSMRFIIELKGDTDTNAAISGYLLGAWYGFAEIEKSQKDNLKKLLIPHELITKFVNEFMNTH